MISAKSGVISGMNMNNMAIYTKSTFDKYYLENQNLTYTKSMKLIKIDKINNGFDEEYQKKKIQLKVYISCPYLTTTKEKNAAGDRINYYLRKSITDTFNTSELSNSLYNPSFSNNYIFTTANVQWI
ncbi:MAG: hypothetical protein LBM96_13165 [Methanobrevibacter sp.]|jgi:hypothetical protein|nr:hypothetical protein [Candidatus Methanoflexus mossambicus]